MAALPTAAISLPNASTLALGTDALAKQLRVVAQLIAAGPGLGMKRQVFMVQIGGFDSHSNQIRLGQPPPGGRWRGEGPRDLRQHARHRAGHE